MPGVLPAIVAAAAAGFGRVVVPVENAAEAAFVPAVRVVAAPAPSGLIGWLRAGGPVAPGWGVRVADSGAGLAAVASDRAGASSPSGRGRPAGREASR